MRLMLYIVLITTAAVKRFIQSQPRGLVCKGMIIWPVFRIMFVVIRPTNVANNRAVT